MTTIFLRRIAVVASLAATVLGLGACERKVPPPLVAIVNAPDRVAIQYEVTGQGEPTLVFVHCWTCDRGDWDAQAAHFAPRHRVVRLDLAGHGRSGRQRRDYTVESFGADVAAVVERVAPKRVVLIGSSMGGPVSVEAAHLIGNRVIGVVGVDTFYTGFVPPREERAINEMLRPFERNFDEAAAGLMRGFVAPGTDPALADAIARRALAADRRMALGALRHILGWYARNMPTALDALGPRLRNINADPKGEGRALHPGVTLVTGSGHFIPREKPAEFNRALEAILRDFASAAPKP